MSAKKEALAIKAVVKESSRLREIEERLIEERDLLHKYNVLMNNKQTVTVIAEDLLNKILGEVPGSSD